MSLRSSVLLRSVAVACLGLTSTAVVDVHAGPIENYIPNGSSHTVKTVEEDWELVVGDVDSNLVAPQIVMLMSPVNSADGQHMLVTLNHGDQPAYSAGGLQLQAWDGDTLVNAERHSDEGVLSTDAETVTWTQRIDVAANGLEYSVRNGSSATWGQFGGSGQFKVTVPSTTTSLNQYNPHVTFINSGVSFAANRVASLKLKKVRVTLENGQQYEFSINAELNGNN
ncbi:MAG: hypothetical protein R3E01_25355 [Pirellulaceae bacterium]